MRRYGRCPAYTGSRLPRITCLATAIRSEAVVAAPKVGNSIVVDSVDSVHSQSSRRFVLKRPLVPPPPPPPLLLLLLKRLLAHARLALRLRRAHKRGQLQMRFTSKVHQG
jgi:hypothetical protein